MLWIFSNWRTWWKGCGHPPKARRHCTARCSSRECFSNWQMDRVSDSNHHMYGCIDKLNPVIWPHFGFNFGNIWFVDGEIKVFRKEDTLAFKLIAEAKDLNPLSVEYVSFGSLNTNLVKLYFNCSFSLATPKTINEDNINALLASDVPPSVNLKNCMCGCIHREFLPLLIRFHPQCFASNVNVIQFLTTITSVSSWSGIPNQMALSCVLFSTFKAQTMATFCWRIQTIRIWVDIKFTKLVAFTLNFAKVKWSLIYENVHYFVRQCSAAGEIQ